MSSGTSRGLVLVSNWKEDTSLPRTGGRSVLPVAATCSWLLEPQLHSNTRAFPKPDSQSHWPQGSRGAWQADVAEAGEAPGWPGGGAWVPAQRRVLQGPGQAPTRTRRRESSALGGILQLPAWILSLKIPRCRFTDQKAALEPSPLPLCSGRSFCKLWRPGCPCQPPVWLSLAVSVSQRAVLLWGQLGVGCQP